MIEVVRRIARHAELLHHAPGSQVGGDRERDDLVQRQGFEAVLYRGASAFSGEALAPMSRRQSPGDFDAGCKVRHETRHIQADEADERTIATKLGGVQAEASLAKMLFDPIHAFVALGAR